MSNGIERKVVLITGGAGGIGSEAARALATRARRSRWRTSTRRSSPRVVHTIDGAVGYKVDVTDQDQVKTIVEPVVRGFGRLDVLINSAGIMLIRPMVEVNTTEWETTIDLNINGR